MTEAQVWFIVSTTDIYQNQHSITTPRICSLPLQILVAPSISITSPHQSSISLDFLNKAAVHLEICQETTLSKDTCKGHKIWIFMWKPNLNAIRMQETPTNKRVSMNIHKETHINISNQITSCSSMWCALVCIAQTTFLLFPCFFFGWTTNIYILYTKPFQTILQLKRYKCNWQ